MKSGSLRIYVEIFHYCIFNWDTFWAKMEYISNEKKNSTFIAIESNIHVLTINWTKSFIGDHWIRPLLFDFPARRWVNSLWKSPSPYNYEMYKVSPNGIWLIFDRLRNIAFLRVQTI